MRNTLKIKKLHEDVVEPHYMTEDAAGFDIAAYLPEGTETVIEPLKTAIISTGLQFEIPKGFEAQVRPRSGLAFKYGISIVNAPGTIDADYRGEVKVCLINLGTDPFKIQNKDRIAQIVIAKLPRLPIKFVKELESTKRGSGGFGHTGR